MKLNDPRVVAVLAAASEQYEAALMANDVATLDAMFWDSPEVVRYGIGENLYGSTEIAAFRAARPGGSPPRDRLRTTITAFGDDFATVNVEFQRTGSQVVGRQSQSWVRVDEGWRIVSAHVSFKVDAA